MKALVVGGGSIGKRHIKNLLSLGVIDIALVEPDDLRRNLIKKELNVVEFQALNKGLNWNPDFVLIASPTNLHVAQALEAAQNGVHLFIEKPLADKNEYLKNLADEVKKKNLITLVGCNMRFHPGPAKVKRMIEQELIGRTLFARIHTGSYLPEWRPDQDYRESYSSSASKGGGCILDCIHEIDLANWYLGDIKQVFCMAEHLSSLEIDVEDVATLTCKHGNGTISEIHLDYVQRTYERGCQIVGEKGTIFWDFAGRSVRWYNSESKTWHLYPDSMNWHINEMYIDELAHFLECVRAGTETMLPVTDALKLMKVVFAAKKSASTGCTIKLENEEFD